MNVYRDIAYAPEHGRSGLADVFRPEGSAGAPVVVVYHGGGLRAMRKERMEHVAEFLARCGYVAVNANYRLLPEAEFPAPVEDAVRVVDWVQTTDDRRLAATQRDQVGLLGASAGGYLALTVGCLLTRRRVRAVASLSGPATRHSGVRFERPWNLPDGRTLAPPVALANRAAPPLLAVHSVNDELVRPSESRTMVAQLRALGVRAELYEFAGPGNQHGLWRDEDDPPRLFPHLETRIEQFPASVFGGAKDSSSPHLSTTRTGPRLDEPRTTAETCVRIVHKPPSSWSVGK